MMDSLNVEKNIYSEIDNGYTNVSFVKDEHEYGKINFNSDWTNDSEERCSLFHGKCRVVIIVTLVIIVVAAVVVPLSIVFSSNAGNRKENADRTESSTTSKVIGGSTTYSTGGPISTTTYQNVTKGSTTQSTDSGTRGWSPWGTWTTCTASCGSGIHKRYRSCNENVSTACYGDYVESEICSITACPVYGKWTTWTSWGSCNVSCGGGVQIRSRTCSKTDSSNLYCVGADSQQTTCSLWKCPDCSKTCEFGTLNTACDTCTCNGNSVTGKVIANDTSYPISNAAIYAATAPTKLLSLSDSLGNFFLNTTCVKTELFVSRTGFQDITIVVEDSYQEITMTKIILPYLVQQPQSKRRLVSESVTFCCSAIASPNITDYEWFKDAVLLNGNGNNITIQDLKMAHQGNYQCRANSPVGAIMSSVASLIIKETPDDFCADALQQKSIALPEDCVQASTNTATYEVGECISKSCRGNETGDSISCQNEERSCCSIGEAVLETVQCSDYELELVVIKSCSCAVCNNNILTISGTALGIKDSSPVKYAEVWVNGNFKGFTSNKGKFNFVVSKSTSKITINIQDTYSNRFLPAVKVVNINKDMSGTLNVEVWMFQSDEPIKIESTVPNTLVAGTSENVSVPIVQISLPANAFYYPNGTQYVGTLDASLTFLDPKKSTDLQNIPGTFQFIDKEGQAGNLASLGVFNLFFSDNLGNPLILDEVIDLYIPNGVNTGNNDIKLWRLNTETGLWEIVYADTGVRRRKRRADTGTWIGEIDWSTISNREWYNYDYVYYLTDQPCFFKVRLFKDKALTENVPNPERYIYLQYHIVNGNVMRTIQDYIYYPEDHCVPGICENENAYISSFYYGRTGYEVMFAGKPELGSLNTPYAVTDGDKVLKIAMSRSMVGPFYQDKAQCIISSAANYHLRYHFGKTSEVFTLLKTFTPIRPLSPSQQDLSRRAWYPKRDPEGYRVCFIKVRVLFEAGTILTPGQSIKLQSSSIGGTDSNIAGVVLGIREFPITSVDNASTYCIEYKCSGIIDPDFDEDFDYTRVTVKLIYPTSDIECTVTKEADFVTSDETALNVQRNGSSNGWEMYAPAVYSPNNGLYSATTDLLDLPRAYETAQNECKSGGLSSVSGENPEKGLALTFTCGKNVFYWWYG